MLINEQFKLFKTQRNHLKLSFQVDGPGVCLYCEIEVSNLQTHANEVHASKLPVKCPDCDKYLPGQKALKVHYAFTHTTGPGEFYRIGWVLVAAGNRPVEVQFIMVKVLLSYLFWLC